MDSIQGEAIDQRFVHKLVKVNGDKSITVTHVTIRQSIFFLIIKLIFIELLAAGIITVFHTVFLTSSAQSFIPDGIIVFNFPLFLTLVVIKTCVTFFVIFQWLEEYYEITPLEIIHKKGFLFKSTEHNTFNHLVSLKIHQDLLGRIFNYGTISLFNWAKNKEVSLYLIHNPMKYLAILEHILPEPDEDRLVFREHLLEPERV